MIFTSLFIITIISKLLGSGDDIEGLLALSGKCSKGGDMGGADALAAALGDTCDMEGMDDKVIVFVFYITTLFDVTL